MNVCCYCHHHFANKDTGKERLHNFHKVTQLLSIRAWDLNPGNLSLDPDHRISQLIRIFDLRLFDSKAYICKFYCSL